MNYHMMAYILGNILRVEGLFLTACALLAVYFGERDALFAFIFTIFATMIIGTVLAKAEPKDKKIYGREGFVIVALAWIIMSFFGAMPFYFSGAIKGAVNCFFETVSGFTTTGASILKEIESLPRSILFWRSFTHWIGGMGILVFMLAIMPTVDERSMHLMRAEAPGPVVSKLVPKVKSTAKLLYGIYVFLTLLEIFLLFLGGMPLFDSIVNAFSTAGTGGFAIKNTSIAAYESPYFEYVITIFMFLFSVNFNLYYLLLIKDVKNVFKNEELRYYLVIILGAIGIITANILSLYPSFESAFRHAAFQVLSIISTTGFATANYEVWPELSKTMLIILTIIGACGGSTGGGIKISRLIILLKMAEREIRHIIHPRSVNIIKLDGHKVDEGVIRGVSGFIIVYLFLVCGSFILVSLDNYDFTTSLSSVLTCLGNVGPGLSMVGPIENYSFFSDFSKLVLCVDMLLGRLEIFPIIMLLSPSIWRRSYM
ncbi:TrkH family potassium uptake protein [Anaerotignum sp. MB30-C6]|uniref:TrkH family potassium uptake protein n=1 Tax=Anaerotignum sp. MB30-C6 TaxID=3070814 RepID=UPI0027DB7BBC|nr:TrkH family potassium uptake protein [Anaerotignum sp. MB30-C6]WMI81541.1 TrkH family potassium uptake protein [Anaerotignum sp. MB30-C6]